MESNNEIKGIDIKYDACYYFDYTINIDDLDLDNILLDEKLYENFLIFNVACTKLHIMKNLFTYCF